MFISKTIEHPYIPSVAEIRLCEQYTMDHEPISSQLLMERAGIACTDEIAQLVNQHHISDIFVFCGSGNNGGDGLVIARHLANRMFESSPRITVVVCQSDPPKHTPEMEANLNRWQEIVAHNTFTHCIVYQKDIPIEIPADALIIDAIFGIGLNKPATGLYAEAIHCINESDALVVAIDTPSGLFSDTPTPNDATIVMADHTLSIQYPKMAHFLPTSYPYCGEVDVVDILMLPPKDLTCKREYLTGRAVADILRPLVPFANKGSQGHGLLIAGSADMPGAAILAAEAVLRSGAGKVTVHSAANVTKLIPTRLPEAILHPDENELHVSALDWGSIQKDVTALAIGPGIGTHPQTITLLKNLLDEVHQPIILDADALNILSKDKTWLAFLPEYSILTPHLKEFERLAGACADDFDRLEKAKAFAKRYSIILVLKGHHTVISMPDGAQFFNTTGNAGMATAGSGDVLTGILLSFLAQGYNPAATALLGVYIHGLAGDLYAQSHSPRTLLASDITKNLDQAFQKLNLETYSCSD